MSDVIVVMRDGRIQQQGSPRSSTSGRSTASSPTSSAAPTSSPARLVEHRRGRHGSRPSRSDRGLTLTRPRDGRRRQPAAGAQRHGRDPARAPASVDAGDGAPTPEAEPAGRGSRDAIHQGTYLGDQTEYRIQTDVAGELIVRRQNATGDRPRVGARPGRAGRPPLARGGEPDPRRPDGGRRPVASTGVAGGGDHRWTKHFGGTSRTSREPRSAGARFMTTAALGRRRARSSRRAAAAAPRRRRRRPRRRRRRPRRRPRPRRRQRAPARAAAASFPPAATSRRSSSCTTGRTTSPTTT